MLGYIDGIDFKELEAMKYFAPPASWSEEKRRTNAIDKIFSGDWTGSTKMDGFFAKFVKDEDGNMMLFSRSRGVDGQFANKFEWVPQLHPYLRSCRMGLVYLGSCICLQSPALVTCRQLWDASKIKRLLVKKKERK